MKICQEELCTGCFACVNICPQKCIKMVEKEYGCIYPDFELGKCTNCNMCKEVCPNNSFLHRSVAKNVYAAWSKKEDDRISSSSGGVASVFSKNIIKIGGVVFGAIGRSYEVAHNMADNLGDCLLFKGSKYVQSHINDSFTVAKDSLLSGREVLFIGTPCQIAGLLRYLGKPFDNLITCDFICHGTPPQKLLKDHLTNILKRNNLSDLEVSFRESNGFFLSVMVPEGKIYCKVWFKDLYYIGFMRSLFLRPSCYNCTFATKERISDVTIGDFWGLGTKKSFNYDTSKGVSVVMPNTKKGETFLELCESDLQLFERSLEEAVMGNPALNSPPSPHTKSDKFVKLYRQFGFFTAANHCLFFDKIKCNILYYLLKTPFLKYLAVSFKRLKNKIIF